MRNTRVIQRAVIVLLAGGSIIVSILGVYALRTAPTLFVDSQVVSTREGIQITKLGGIRLQDSDLWKLPAFTSPHLERGWWHAQRQLYEALTDKNSTVIEFTSNLETWQLVAQVGRMPMDEVLKRVWLIDLVGIIFIYSAIMVFHRHPTSAGFLAAFFLASTALYLISIAPVVHRSLILDNKLLRILINTFFVASTGQLSIVHFAMLFPRKKRFLRLYPWLTSLFYLYALVISALYVTGIIALATMLPFLFLWIFIFLGGIAHSVLREKDIILRNQTRISLLAPLLVAIFFVVSVILPWTMEKSALINNFSLFSLMLPFALMLSLDNRRLYKERLNTEYELRKEKERIHRELHDSVLNDLASIMIVTEGAQSFLHKDPVKVNQRLREIKEIAVDTSQQLRNFLWVVDDRQNHWADIVGLLRKTGYDLMNPKGTSFEINVDWAHLKSPVVSPALKHTLQKILREAMINISKHAHAKNATLSFAFDDQFVSIIVEDDGNGFEPGSISRESYGLENMRRRIEENGGELTIETQEGTGTRLTIHLPLT